MAVDDIQHVFIVGSMDLGYIARRGVMTDLKLILQTVAVVFTGKGAA